MMMAIRIGLGGRGIYPNPILFHRGGGESNDNGVVLDTHPYKRGQGSHFATNYHEGRVLQPLTLKHFTFLNVPH